MYSSGGCQRSSETHQADNRYNHYCDELSNFSFYDNCFLMSFAFLSDGFSYTFLDHLSLNFFRHMNVEPTVLPGNISMD